MISRVAVVPQPPLLVPELVGGPDAGADEVRTASLAAASALAESAARWVAVGAGGPATFDPATGGTFAPFGVDIPVSLSRVKSGQLDRGLPLPVLVAGWLRDRAGADEVTVRLVPGDRDSGGCAADGVGLAALLAGPEPVGLLVVGDGSHRHGDHAVGRPDGRAEAFDATVSRALAAADLDALAGLDPALAAELGAVGRAPWQVAAAALRADGRRWRGVRARTFLPYGVAYHVAEWEPA
ncbi:class III extradiol ring-cleavage dioxygenase family protein [Actinokineospora pegani]|uniref:hypothetical protein n=1 Tax=Actinokineospora pegani TaxID=2654637 RepID=UPI0012E9A5C6|nr:hypothetical protein [Actinokineospora pegani]